MVLLVVLGELHSGWSVLALPAAALTALAFAAAGMAGRGAEIAASRTGAR